MKTLLARIMWKIQQIAITKFFELCLLMVVAGAITSFITQYLIIQHMDSIYSDIFVLVFVFYAGYKIMLD